MFRSLYAGLVVIAGSMTGCIVPNREGSAIMSANEHSKTRMLAEFEGDSPRFDDLSGEWRIVNDNIIFTKLVHKIGRRENITAALEDEKKTATMKE